MKLCTKCKAEKPRIEFSRNRANRDGLQGACKPCNRAQVAAWAKVHPIRAARRMRRTNLRRRAILPYGYKALGLRRWQRNQVIPAIC